jgi:hypothetical protein
MDVPPCQVGNTSELTHLLASLNRLHQFLVMKLHVAKDTAFVSKTIDWMFPYMKLYTRNTSESLQAENINLFFWRSICQRQVSSKRASDAAMLSAKQSANNEMLSKAEQETKNVIDLLDIVKQDSEKESSNCLVHRLLTPREINIFFDKTYKAVRLSDATYIEESICPKLDIFELTMSQGIFSNEVADNEYTNQSTLSKLLGSSLILPRCPAETQKRQRSIQEHFRGSHDRRTKSPQQSFLQERHKLLCR